MSHIRTSLRNAPNPPISEEEMFAMRRKAWHSQGCIVFFPKDITDDWLRQALINEANKTYGLRNR
ncbi:MAG TPA: hypothetical protein VND94_00880 [Terriglobia bacterium]|nr:hypothetical protein [Terriglobia bacterium]